MQFVDLQKQYQTYKTEIDAAIHTVLDHGQYINGPEVGRLESSLSEFLGFQYSVACSSGTDALSIPMMALGLKPGDEVIVPAFTFFATAEMVSLLGAVPIFVDVESEYFNIDPSKIEEKITERTVGIIPVGLYGQLPPMRSIHEIAKRHGLWVILDGAQSLGAQQRGHTYTQYCDAMTTSFFPAKPLGGYGDGGAIFSNNADLAEKMKVIRNHGQVRRYVHAEIGMNGRLDTIQAAIIEIKLKYFPEELVKRNQVAEIYTTAFGDRVKTPAIMQDNTSTWAQYTICVENREKIREDLNRKDIPTAVHYPIPLYRQEAYVGLAADSSEYPVSEYLSERVLSLPMHAFMEESEIEVIVDQVIEAL